jgi:hypothetical protein
MEVVMKKMFASLASLAGAAVFVALFIPFVQFKGEASESYQGWKVVIGYKESEGGLSLQVFKFSFMNMLPFLLALMGIGTASKGGGSAFLGVICFAGAAVLLYMAPQFIQMGEFASLLGKPEEIFELAKGGKIAMYAAGGGAVLSLLSMIMPADK